MMTAALPPSLDRVIQRVQRLSNPKQKYEQLIWFAKRLQPFPEDQKIAENKVPGCTSQVYVTAALDGEVVTFAGDSDSQLTKGLVGLLVEGLGGLSPEVIQELTPDFIRSTGLEVSLTPSRANGFYNIFKTMQQKAIELKHP